MLFPYPVEATADNWLHDCLCEILTTIHQCVRQGIPTPAWPALIPQARRDRIRKRTGLRDRLNAYADALRTLTPLEQERVARAIVEQNRIAELVSCSCDCESLDLLPSGIRDAISQLFDYSFRLLSELEIRDAHYRCVYERMTDHLCPFCGCEYFDAPGAPREALDHYLAKSLYPCAAANLRNLAPMGSKCNSRYKLSKDILRKDGVRRKSFDPYGDSAVSIALLRSAPFAGTDGKLPRWQVDFAPDSDEARTWDDVFDIRTRYRRDVLDPSFNRWLNEFRAWWRSAPPPPSNADELVSGLGRYAVVHEASGFGEGSFLKAAVFRMLERHCQAGHQRLIALLLDLVAGA